MTNVNQLAWHFYPIDAAYLVAGGALLALSAWSISGFRRTRSPLTKYLAASGLVASGYFLASSLPFMLSTNLQVLKLATNLADLAYYLTIIIQTRMIWYLAFNKQAGYNSLLAPVLALASIGSAVSVFNVWHIVPTLSAGILHYPIPPALLHLDALLDTLFLIVGIYVLKIGRVTANARGKIRIFSLALAYLAGGIIGIYNALFVGGASDSTPIIIIYTLVFGLLLAVSMVGRLQNIN